jgi:hypothetical protein
MFGCTSAPHASRDFNDFTNLDNDNNNKTLDLGNMGKRKGIWIEIWWGTGQTKDGMGSDIPFASIGVLAPPTLAWLGLACLGLLVYIRFDCLYLGTDFLLCLQLYKMDWIDTAWDLGGWLGDRYESTFFSQPASFHARSFVP